MGAAAQFHRVVAHLHHAHDLAVFLPEDRRSAHFSGLIERLLETRHRHVLPNFFIDQPFHRFQIPVTDRRKMREVEAQPIRGHQRSGLVHVIPERLSERTMQKMRGRMIPGRGSAWPGVHHCA